MHPESIHSRDQVSRFWLQEPYIPRVGYQAALLPVDPQYDSRVRVLTYTVHSMYSEIFALVV
jgi:hypothetical protein